MNASKGNEILQSLRQLRHFYDDCALLLKTGEAALIETGWQNCFGNTAIADLSKSIEYPEWWPPYFAFRFFKSERYKSLIAFISIIFDIPDEPNVIAEPLVSAGLLDYGEKSAATDWEYYIATYHVYMPNRQDDGSLLTVDPRKEWTDERHKMSQLKTLAHPLVSITSAQELKDRVIQPLFQEIAKYRQAIPKGTATKAQA